MVKNLLIGALVLKKLLLLAVLLGFAPWASAAYVLACTVNPGNATNCNTANQLFVDTNQLIPPELFIYRNSAQNAATTSAISWVPAYVDSTTINSAYTCSVQPVIGFTCPGVGGTGGWLVWNRWPDDLAANNCVPASVTVSPCPTGFAPKFIPEGTSFYASDWSPSKEVEGITVQYIAMLVGCAVMFGMGAGFGKS